MKRIWIGTRGSALAMAQATAVQEQLRQLHPGVRVEIRVIRTKGDQVQDRPLHQVGGTGLFTREIERALLEGKVDVAVHSLKDLPAQMRPGLVLGAVPRREDPRDVLICPDGLSLDDLPEGATVATGALRRRVQLLRRRPDLRLTDIRGNLDTRLRKVAEQPELAATMLAAAGLNRMGWSDRATQYLDVEEFIPAGGQGAIGVQIRAGDTEVAELVAPLNDPDTARTTAAERAFLAELEAGCQVPVAVHARIEGDRMSVAGILAGLDAEPYYSDRVEGPAADAEALGRQLAGRILAAGGRELRESLRELV